MKKRNLTPAVIAVILILIVTVGYLKIIAPGGAPAMVVPADDRDYFSVVHGLLTGAQRSIDVIVYQGRFYFQYPLSTSNTLMADLADAAARGVKVRAVLEQADWNPENSEDNHDAWNVLSTAGVATYFDPLETTSHSKLIIVDGKYSVVGSMNWSYYALDKNNEATVVVESEKIGKQFEKYFGGIVAASSPLYERPGRYMTAAEIPEVKERTVFVNDVVDSGKYLPERKEGLLYLGDVTVRVDSDALEEILAVDSLFFSEVAGDTVRIFGQVEKDDKHAIHALDVETGKTTQAMAQAFGVERSKLKAMSFPKPMLAWTRVSRVIPVPNEKYVPEVLKLIRSARKRVWVAMLDARYYETRPVPAERDKPRPKGAPPSLTNLILESLRDAARRGVDVRVICDMGRGGSAPNSKLAFLKGVVEAGGKAYEDSPDVTTHAKVAIVDDDFTVIGSTNWTQPAVEENNETAIVIESPELTSHYAAFIGGIIEAGKAFVDGDRPARSQDRD